MLSNLELVAQCDRFPYLHKDPDLYNAKVSTYYKFYVEGSPSVLGWVLPSTIPKITWSSHWKIDHNAKTVLLLGTTIQERDAHLRETLLATKAAGVLKDLKGWREELFSVYGPDKIPVVSIERAASSLFGIMGYGVHLNAYVIDEEGKIKYWVAKRTLDRKTHPGMLDTTVGGGKATGEDPFDCMVRESTEEASFDKELLRRDAKSVGVVTYFYVTDERSGGEIGTLSPECVYIYDILVSADFQPKPADHSVECFMLMDVEELKEALAADKFKTNCALVLIDFFIRQGIITPENEKDYIEIVARLHRNPEFPCA